MTVVQLLFTTSIDTIGDKLQRYVFKQAARIREYI